MKITLLYFRVRFAVSFNQLSHFLCEPEIRQPLAPHRAHYYRLLWSSNSLGRETGIQQQQYLDEDLSYRDERSAELCGEKATDEEITQSSSEELKVGHAVQSAAFM